MQDNKEKYILPVAILIAAFTISGALIYTDKSEKSVKQESFSTQTQEKEKREVTPVRPSGSSSCGV